MTLLRAGAPTATTAALLATLALSTAGCGSGSDEPSPTAEGSVRPTLAEPSAQDTGEPADPDACDGVIGERTVTRVRVPEGATCRLEGTRVDGNVSVGHGATLVARGVTVDGDLEAEGARAVAVSGRSHIGGNLQVQRGGSVRVVGTRVDGDLEWEELTGRLLALDDVVGGNLEADRNTGHVTISRTEVDGDLSCEENRTIDGGRNQVRGDREDQCRRL